MRLWSATTSATTVSRLQETAGMLPPTLVLPVIFGTTLMTILIYVWLESATTLVVTVKKVRGIAGIHRSNLVPRAIITSIVMTVTFVLPEFATTLVMMVNQQSETAGMFQLKPVLHAMSIMN